MQQGLRGVLTASFTVWRTGQKQPCKLLAYKKHNVSKYCNLIIIGTQSRKQNYDNLSRKIFMEGKIYLLGKEWSEKTDLSNFDLSKFDSVTFESYIMLNIITWTTTNNTFLSPVFLCSQYVVISKARFFVVQVLVIDLELNLAFLTEQLLQLIRTQIFTKNWLFTSTLCRRRWGSWSWLWRRTMPSENSIERSN